MQSLYFLLVAVAASSVRAQYPDGCACPEECDCFSLIDCSSQSLTYVPREINSCAWPGITTVYAIIVLCLAIKVKCLFFKLILHLQYIQSSPANYYSYS